MTQITANSIEDLIDAQDDPKSRGTSMVLFRLIQDIEREHQGQLTELDSRLRECERRLGKD